MAVPAVAVASTALAGQAPDTSGGVPPYTRDTARWDRMLAAMTPTLAPDQVACPGCAVLPGERCLPTCPDPEERRRFADLLTVYGLGPCCLDHAWYRGNVPRRGIVSPTRTFTVSTPQRGGPWMHVTYYTPHGPVLDTMRGQAQIRVAVPHRSDYRTSIRTVPRSTVTAAIHAFCLYPDADQQPDLLRALSAAVLPLIYVGGPWDGTTKAQRMFALDLIGPRLGLHQLPDGRWGCAGVYENYPGALPGSVLDTAEDLILMDPDTTEVLSVLWPYLTGTATPTPLPDGRRHT